MLPAIKLQASTPPKPFLFRYSRNTHNKLSQRRKASAVVPSTIPSFAAFPFSSLSLPTAPSAITDDASPPYLTSSVGSPPSVPLGEWNLNRRHIHLLNAIACVTAISAAWLFFSAIPALLAFKKAAESLEKLLDVTREELPDTMAAVRLSGMEISDLTMELSDLGQEITQGVRNSTRAVRLAEDRLRRLTTMAPTAMVQETATPKTEIMEPVVARSARSLKEGIVKGRAVLQFFFSLTQFSRWAMKYVPTLGKKR